MAGSEYNIKLVLEAQNKISRELDRVSADLNKMKKSSKGTFDSMRAGLAGLGIVAGFKKIAGGTITLAGNLEQAEVAFTTMLGSADKAKKMLNDLTTFAQTTPFELTGIRETAKQLLAMGTPAEDMLPTLKSLGDISAGLSVPMERLALNFGQVRIQGKLTGRELRDFSVAGVPLIAELSKNLKVSEEAIGSMVSAGKIGFKDVEQAFTTMTGEGGKFANLMDKQAKTLQGTWSNLQDGVSKLGETIGTLFIPVLTSIINFINPIITSIGDRAAAHPELAKAIGIAITAVVGLVAAVTLLLPIITAMGAAFGLVFGPIGLIIGAIALVVGGLYALNQAMSPLNTKSLPTLNKELADTDKELAKVQKQFKDGEMSLDSYTKKSIELHKAQKTTKDLIALTSLKAYDYKGAMEALAKLKLPNNDKKFIDEKNAIIEETKATIALAKAQMALLKVQQGFAATKSIQIDNGFQTTTLDLGGIGGFDSGSAAIEQYQSTIDEATNYIQNFDEEISNMEDSLDNIPVDPMAPLATSAKDAVDPMKELKDEMQAYADENAKVSQMKFDDMNTSLQTSFDMIVGLKKEAEGLKDSLDRLNEGETKDLAGRYIEIEQEMAKLKEDGLELSELLQLNALEKEKQSAFEGMGTEEIDLLNAQIEAQKEYNALSGIEKIKADYAVKREEIQLELDAKTAALDVEIAKFAETMTIKQESQKKWMGILKLDHAAKMNMMADELEMLRKIAAMKSSGSGSSGARALGGPVQMGREYLVGENGPEMFVPSSHGNIVPNNQITNNQGVEINLGGVTVNNQADADYLVEQLARQIQLEREQGIS